MPRDAFAPPATDVTVPQARATALHSPQSVAIATFFGSTLAGGVLLAINYARLDRPEHVTKTVLASAVGTSLLFALFWVLPENLPNSVLMVPQLFGMYQLTRALQGEAIERHQAGGGSMASRWVAVGIGLLGTLVVGVALAAVVLILEGDELLRELGLMAP